MIVEAMEAIAEVIRAVTDRPVTTDPASTTVTPCVLVEVPELDWTSGGGSARTMCATLGASARFPVLVIGAGITRASLPALDELLTAVLGADLEFSQAHGIAYQPTNNAATADPVLAYRVYVEEML
jgi:hypothetical protein